MEGPTPGQALPCWSQRPRDPEMGGLSPSAIAACEI